MARAIDISSPKSARTVSKRQLAPPALAARTLRPMASRTARSLADTPTTEIRCIGVPRRRSPHSVITMLRRLELRPCGRWCGRSMSSPTSSSSRSADTSVSSELNIRRKWPASCTNPLRALPLRATNGHVGRPKRSDVTTSSMSAYALSLASLREALGHAGRTQITAAVVRQHGIAGADRFDGALRAVAHRHLSPGCETLIVIAHHERLTALRSQQHEPLVLNGIGVLELIHQHMLEARPVVLQQRRVVAPELVGAQEQFREIHHARSLAGVFVRLIDLDQLAPRRVAVILDVLRSVPFVLLRIDEPEDFARNPAGLVKIERLQYFAQHARLILGIQNLKALRQSGFAPMDAQQPVRQTVKGPQPHGAARHAQQGFDAPSHFARTLVGRGDRQDAVGRCPLDLDQPREPMDQYPRLAAAGAREYQGSTQGRGHGFPLVLVEAVENV